MTKECLFYLLVSMAFLSSCAKPELKVELEKGPFPYNRIDSQGEENPADYGPDDSTVLDAVDGKWAPVPFSHYTHASNAKDGYGIDCLYCHHDAKTADDSTGCKDCHEQGDGANPALLGPDDNVRIQLTQQTITPVLFSHFSHASMDKDGYKIGCDRCHHVEGDFSKCAKCHKDAATRKNGKIVPKLKRAFHLSCKNCHVLSNNKNATTECKGCHSNMRRTPPKALVALSRAYHVQCINCHQLVNAATQKDAPVNCDRCHRRPKN